jgi:hypothetical protein
MTRPNKPTFAQLLDWLEGRMDQDDARELEKNLKAGDPETEADLAWLRAFLDTSEAARLTTLPQEVQNDLVRKFEAFSRDRRAPNLLERLVAVLTFDSHAGPALAGVRSVQAQGKQRQLIYETEHAEIALNIFPNSQDENMTLNGQIYPKGGLIPSGLSVQVLAAEGLAEKGLTTSDNLGEFILEGLPQGRYGILISSAGFEIALPEIHLQR